MNFIISLPLFSIIACFIGAVICAISHKKISYVVSLVVISVVFTFSLITMLYCLKEDQYFIYTMGHFSYEENADGIRLCNEIRFGVLECGLAAFFSIILGCALLGGHKFVLEDVKENKINFFHVMICLVLVACISLIYTNDIFTGYVFLEISTIASCGLLAIKEKGKTTLAAIRYMVFNLVGSSLFLIGIIMLYDLTGYLSIENIATYLKTATLTPSFLISFVLITIGLSIKSGLFPFHFWMPDAYGNATPTASSILSGMVSKGYIILLIKVVYRMFTYEVMERTGLLLVFFILGVLGMIVGSINAIHQKDINKMVAFSSAAQIGYIFMGIGLGSQAALLASIFHIMTHAITKPLLFISTAKLTEVANRHHNFKSLRGVGRVDILSGIAFSIGAFSMVGLPIFAGFMSKYLFAVAALSSNETWIIIVAYAALIISTLLNAIYFVRTVVTIYSPIPEDSELLEKNDKKVHYAVSYIIGITGFALLNIFLGFGSDFIVDLIHKGLEMF